MSPNKASARGRWLVHQLIQVWPMIPGTARREIIDTITRSVAPGAGRPSECPPPASSSSPVQPPGMPLGGT